MIWYSRNMKPVLNAKEKGGLVLVIGGSIHAPYIYDPETNTCLLEEFDKQVDFSDVDAWGYYDEIYPKETII